MTSLLSSLARSLSGEASRSYSATGSSSIKSLPSFNDFNSMTLDASGEALPARGAGHPPAPPRPLPQQPRARAVAAPRQPPRGAAIAPAPPPPARPALPPR
jgi:hypothetical protein